MRNRPGITSGMEGKKCTVVKFIADNRGLTLVEIAIAMIILGLLIGLGASMLGPLTKRAKQAETTDIIAGSVEAISGYAITNRKLPVWTDGNNTLLSANEFHYIVRSRNDAWSSPIFYRFAGNPNLSTVDVCTATTTNLAVTHCSNTLCTTPQVTRDIAFIVYSAGMNKNYQTILPGLWPPPPTLNPPTLPSPYPTGIYTAYVYDQGISMGTNRVSSSITPLIPVPNTNPLQNISDMRDNGCSSNEDRCRYDDVVKYVTLTELKTKIGCTKYDLCSSGITVRNQSSGSLYYKQNGGACALWPSSADVNLASTDSYQLYTDTTCTITCTSQSFMTFSQQKDVDINNNCQTAVNPGCLIVDR